MSIAEKLAQIAENEPRVYEAGRKAEYDAFWDAAQENGNRTDYSFAFSGNMWSQGTFKPKYPIKPTKCTNMLAYWGYANTILNNELIDLRFLSLDLSDCTDCSRIFYANRVVKNVGEIDGRSLALDNLFSSCFNLESVDGMRVTEKTTFSNTFESCYALKSITFFGTVASDIDLHWSTQLSAESIQSILTAADESIWLEERTHFTVTLSKAAVNRAFETETGANNGTESEVWRSHINNTEGYYTTVLL